jgi:hypothetical protein
MSNCSEGRIAIVALIALAIWLFVGLPLLYSSDFSIPHQLLEVKGGELLIFGATVALWWATWRLVKGAEKTAERQLRAYVGPKMAFVQDLWSKQPKVQIGLNNFGLTPAFAVTAKTFHYFQTATVENTGHETTDHPFGILDPNNPNFMLVRLKEISSDVLQEIADGTQVLQVRTVVQYRDIHNIQYERIFTHYLNNLFIKDGPESPMHIAPNSNSERVL